MILQLNIHVTFLFFILFGWLLFLLFVEDQQGGKGYIIIIIYYKIGLLMNR